MQNHDPESKSKARRWVSAASLGEMENKRLKPKESPADKPLGNICWFHPKAEKTDDVSVKRPPKHSQQIQGWGSQKKVGKRSQQVIYREINANEYLSVRKYTHLSQKQALKCRYHFTVRTATTSALIAPLVVSLWRAMQLVPAPANGLQRNRSMHVCGAQGLTLMGLLLRIPMN